MRRKPLQCAESRTDTAEKAEEAAKILRQRSEARLVVIKMGKRGAMLYCGGRAEVYPAPEVKVVDTTAAGDAFTAAMAVEYIKSGDIQRAVRFANIAGAITVTRLGAQPSLPLLSEVQKFIKERDLSW